MPASIHLKEPATIKEFQNAISICAKTNELSIDDVVVSFPCEKSNDYLRENVIFNKKIDMMDCRLMKGNPEFKKVVIFSKRLCDDLFDAID